MIFIVLIFSSGDFLACLISIDLIIIQKATDSVRQEKVEEIKDEVKPELWDNFSKDLAPAALSEARKIVEEEPLAKARDEALVAPKSLNPFFLIMLNFLMSSLYLSFTLSKSSKDLPAAIFSVLSTSSCFFASFSFH